MVQGERLGYVCKICRQPNKIDGGEMRLLNDDEVLATIDSPEDILHEF